LAATFAIGVAVVPTIALPVSATAATEAAKTLTVTVELAQTGGAFRSHTLYCS
jgi:hypothetical protein